MIKRKIYLILILITFLMIFIFSNQDGEKSKGVSRTVMKDIVDVWPGTKKIDAKEKNVIVENSQHVIRKMAHFTIYTIAGMMIMSFLITFDNISIKKKIVITVIIGGLYAISDECHQIFSNGRTPLIGDVFIDTSGVILGLLLVLVVHRFFSEKAIKRSI